MNRYHGIFLMVMVIPMVFGVPLLNRVKRQNPEGTNELPDNPENLGDQNQPDGQLADKTNDVPDESPELEPGAPMVGADNSPYRKYNFAPGYGDQEQSAVTAQEPNAPQNVSPQENMALPLEDTSRSGQPLPVIPVSGQPLNDAQGQYISQSGEGLLIPPSGEPVVEGGEPAPQQDINQNQPDGQIADQRYPTIDFPDESPKQQPVAPMVGVDNSPYRKYNFAPGYGDQDQEPNSPQDVPPQENMALPLEDASRSGQPVPVIPVSGQPLNAAQGQYISQSGEGLPIPPSGEPVVEGGDPGPQEDINQNQPDGQIADQRYPTNDVPDESHEQQPVAPMVGADNSPYRKYNMAPGYGDQDQAVVTGQEPNLPLLSEGLVPPGFGGPQNQYEGNNNSPYVPPQVPESGQTNQFAGDVSQQYESNPNPNAGQPMLGSGKNLPVQPQPDSEFPQNQYIPYAPSRMPVSGENLPVQPQVESELTQNQNPGDLNQQYYNPIAPSQNAGYVNPVLQPQAESGLTQNQNPGDVNQQYYNPIAPSQNAGYFNSDLQPQVATDSPNVNSTIQKATLDYANTETETPDYWGWWESNYGDDDLYPDPDGDGDDLLNQYYSDESENSYYSFDLFGNGNNLNDENKNEPTDNDVWNFESSEGEEPFNPYESLDDESYQNMLKQEEDDFKTFEEEYGDGNIPPKPASPGDRLQPGIYTNWQLDNSQPPSTSVNPQAANSFLLYCIPAILLTLIIYVGYTNWIRKPKIVRIPSGNNWRADYRDIEAKSREIEPMLRKAEMY